METFLSVIEKIKSNWLKRDSIPYVIIICVAAYFILSYYVSGWNDVLNGLKDYLGLAVPFIVGLVVYIICCGVHSRSEKKRTEMETDMKDNTGNKNSKNIILLTVCIGVVVIVSVFLCVFLLGNGTDKRDGEYVIWSDEYQVALSPEIHNSYYLLGSAVNTDGNRLSEYSERSVFELDFNDDDTFTIAYNGKLLGVTPGKNGVGYSDSCTSVTWTLIEVEDGLYYIRNVDENTYLKWFEHMNNWTTHPNIVDSNRDQFLICLKKVD